MLLKTLVALTLRRVVNVLGELALTYLQCNRINKMNHPRDPCDGVLSAKIDSCILWHSGQSTVSQQEHGKTLAKQVATLREAWEACRSLACNYSGNM